MNRRGGSIVSLLPVLAAVMGTTGIVAGYTHYKVTVAPVDIAAEFDAKVEAEQEDYVQLASATKTVAQDDGQLERRLRSFGLRMSSDGKLPGRITIIDPTTGDRIIEQDIRVLFVQRGRIIQTVRPGLNGVFQASGLQPGVYSIIAAGKFAFMGMSARILPPGEQFTDVEAGNEIRMVSHSAGTLSGMQIDGAGVPRQDFKPLKEIVDVYLPRVNKSEVSSTKRRVATKTVSYVQDETSIPPTPEPVTEPDAPKTDNESELTSDTATPATSISNHAVRLTAGGDLTGRIRRLNPQTGRPMPIRRMNIFLLKNGELFTQTTIRENGTFLVRNVPPGVYSFVSASQEGFLAFGVQLVSSTVDTRTAGLDIPTELVANILAMQDGTELESSVIPEEDSEIVRDEVENLEDDEDDGEEGGEEEGAAAPGTGGGGGTTGGGGGGAAGGGGGILPAVIGAGVGAAVGAALADDNNNDTSP